MPVRTKRLAVGTSGGAGSLLTIYTCPADETAIVKDVSVKLNLAISSPLGEVAATSGGTRVPFLLVGGAQYAVVRWVGWIVLMPGDTLNVWHSTAAAFAFWVSGTELEGVAD